MANNMAAPTYFDFLGKHKMDQWWFSCYFYFEFQNNVCIYVLSSYLFLENPPTTHIY